MNAAPAMRAADCWNRIGIWGDRSCPELKVQLHCRNCPIYSAGAARLLDAKISEEELTRLALHYATPQIEERVGTVAVVVFRLGAEWFALPAVAWREVVALRPVHSLPHRRDKVVTGIVNVRGELLVCVSLATALGVEPTTQSIAPRFAVIQRAADCFVFPADEIAGLHRYGATDLTSAPITLARLQAPCTRGMLALADHAVGVLDADCVFQTLNRSLA